MSWPYGSWIYNYLCNQVVSSNPVHGDVLDTTFYNKVYK